MKTLAWRILGVSALCFYMVALSANDTVSNHGAQVYLERCALCHGSKGLGEGPMALLISGYPNTKLKSKNQTDQPVQHIVEFGDSKTTSTRALSPPWGDELSASDITAVTEFIGFLREDYDYAMRLLASVEMSPDRVNGKRIYRSRCVTCHGVAGKGDGRLSRLFSDRPPSDLTLSRLTHEETITIVLAGGEAVGRSEKMPPWGLELLHSEVQSVVAYLSSIRVPKVE